MTIIEIEVTIHSKCLEINAEFQLEDLELHHNLPTETRIGTSVVDNSVIVLKNALRITFLQVNYMIERDV